MNKLLKLIVIIGILFFLHTPCMAERITDDFSGSQINPIWTEIITTYDGSSIYPLQTNGRLEIRADGGIANSAGLALKTPISLNRNFRVKVDFNSQECSYNCFMGLFIFNASKGLYDETLLIFNGHDYDYFDTRSWGAGYVYDDQPSIDGFADVMPTNTTSGTFYITYLNNVFYFSYTGFGSLNSIFSISADEWTSGQNVIIAIIGMSRNQYMSGQGSYFDNFVLEFTGDKPFTDREKADIIFNWLESLVPEILKPSPQQTLELFGIIFRYYPATNVYIATYQNHLFYIDHLGYVHDLGEVDLWLPIAQGA